MTLIVDLLNLLKIHIDGPQGHVFEGGAIADIFLGTGGDDYAEGKGGLDTLSGGAGIDTLSYRSSNAGVNVDLAPGFLGLFITRRAAAMPAAISSRRISRTSSAPIIMTRSRAPTAPISSPGLPATILFTAGEAMTR